MVRKATTSTGVEPSTRSSMRSSPRSRAVSPMNETNGILPSRRPEPPRNQRTSRIRSGESSGPITRRQRRIMESTARGGSSMEGIPDGTQRYSGSRPSRRRRGESGTRRGSSTGYISLSSRYDWPGQNVINDLAGVGSFDSVQPPFDADTAPTSPTLHQGRAPEGSGNLGEELSTMDREMRERRRRERPPGANRHPRPQTHSTHQQEQRQDIPMRYGRPRRRPDSPHQR